MSPKIIPVTKFRTKVLESVRKAQKVGQEYVITNKGKPAAVLMSFEDWEGLIETLEIKKDKKLMKDIQKSLSYFKSSKKGKAYQDINWD